MSCPPTGCEPENKLTVGELMQFLTSWPEDTVVECAYHSDREPIPVCFVEFYTNNKGQRAVAIVI